MINYGWGREGQVFGNGEDYPKGSYYAVFLVSLFWHTLFLAVIKTQATHDWTVKTSLKKICRKLTLWRILKVDFGPGAIVLFLFIYERSAASSYTHIAIFQIQIRRDARRKILTLYIYRYYFSGGTIDYIDQKNDMDWRSLIEEDRKMTRVSNTGP